MWCDMLAQLYKEAPFRVMEINSSNGGQGMAIPTASGLAQIDAVPPLCNDAEAVLAQMERIVESPGFRNSKRYPRFLRFIVEQTMLGHADRLKERLLGIEVFDRPHDYDLATDPIVRVAAGEVRKRLAQYYAGNSRESELRIQLQPGSYVPEFHPPPKAALSEATLNAAPLASVPVPNRSIAHFLPLSKRMGITIVGVGLSLATILCLYIVRRPSPIQEFWQPFMESASPPLICVGDQSHAEADESSEGSGLRTGINSFDYLALGDVEALHRISTIFDRRDKVPSISNSRSTTFAELCRQPVVLIGGSPNQWTMRSMQLLRYQLVANFTPGINGILDRDDPHRLRWSVDFNAPYSTIPSEYAIIARFSNPTIGQPTVIAAGVGANGEIAAAEFLTTPAYFNEFAHHAPRDWAYRNVEIILKTQMINGTNGPPQVVATYFW